MKTLIRFFFGLIAVFGFASTAPAQDAKASPPSVLGTGEIQLEVDQFGVGGSARYGDWAGIRVKILDTGTRQREIIVRIIGPDTDNDSPAYDRQVATNPGQSQLLWLYARLPFTFTDGTMRLAAYEAVESGGGKPTIGRLLTMVRLAPKTAGDVLDPAYGLIGVMGNKVYSLERYRRVMNSVGEIWAPLGHEADFIVNNITPADLPDRWQGLQQFEAIVWGEGAPSDLRGERSRALREYINRGGHLVILLPASGQTWTSEQANELIDILPVVDLTRREGVKPEPYRGLLTLDPNIQAPPSITLYTFTPRQGARPGEAIRLLNGPDGECVVARRLVGQGAVTLIGLNLVERMVETDVFWNRILGRRGRLPRFPDAEKMPEPVMNRKPFAMDMDIAFEVASSSGRAPAGVLLGFIVFGLYWLVAGPLGFAMLKRRKMGHHAWLAFFSAGVVFTAIAWGGASAIKPSRVEATHVTFVDHVFGQPVSRARGWFGLLLPWYGDATVSVGDESSIQIEPDTGIRRNSNLIAPWEPPEEQRSFFPDNRAYATDCRAPDSMTFPTRATVKQLQADWSGGPVWKMPYPVPDQNGKPTDLKVKPREGASPEVEGTLVHELPGDLHDVIIIVVSSQIPIPTPGPSVVPPQWTYIAHAVKIPSAWRPNEPRDIGLDFKSATGTNFNQLMANITPKVSLYSFDGARPTAGKTEDRLTLLALFEQIPPPEKDSSGESAIAARRPTSHNWDLSRWFTQPCIIIIGHLGGQGHQGVDSPIPLFASKPGETPKRVPTKGRTVVRWVYPLPDNPPAFRSDASGSAGSTTPPNTPDG